jgi:hypothetical protein
MMTTPPANEIRLVESNGQHFVSVVMDGHEMRQHGPFANADAAEAMAIRFAGICGVFNKPMEIRHG